MREYGFESLLNNGMISINHDISSSRLPGRSKNTVIVSGIARGGTSMVARLLADAGLFMGEARDGVVFEDVDMARALQCSDRAFLRDLISSRNQSHDSWGFKRPQIHETLHPEELGLFRNPHIILVLRDPIAVAQRNILSMHSNPRTELDSAMAALGGLISFATEVKIPVLLVSYEKALMKRADFIARVIAFCGMDVREARLAALNEAIVPEDSMYLRNTELRLEGRIERIAGGKLIGWGRIPQEETPLMFDLMIDHHVAATFIADECRAGSDNDQGVPGNFGFCLDLSGFGLTDSSLISVRMSGRNLYLEGSRRTVRMLSNNDPGLSLSARPKRAFAEVRRRRMPYLSKMSLRRAFVRFRKR